MYTNRFHEIYFFTLATAGVLFCLGVSIPLKFHVLERHCQEFLEDMGGHHGLGYYSEHPFESTHNKVNVDWGVNPLNENHQDYDEKMTDFVVGFNGKQL